MSLRTLNHMRGSSAVLMAGNSGSISAG